MTRIGKEARGKRDSEVEPKGVAVRGCSAV